MSAELETSTDHVVTSIAEPHCCSPAYATETRCLAMHVSGRFATEAARCSIYKHTFTRKQIRVVLS